MAAAQKEAVIPGEYKHAVRAAAQFLWDKTRADYTFSVLAETVFISEHLSGSDLRPWIWVVDRRLISLFNMERSDFRFVRSGGDRPQPQTGNVKMPLLWARIAALCLLGAAVMIHAMRKRQTRID